MKKNEIRPIPVTLHKSKLNRSKTNVMPFETLKIIADSIGSTQEDIGAAKNFLSRTPVIQELRSTIYRWNLIKLKSFFTAKETTSLVKRKARKHVNMSMVSILFRSLAVSCLLLCNNKSPQLSES